jgi:hypothetical protein
MATAGKGARSLRGLTSRTEGGRLRCSRVLSRVVLGVWLVVRSFQTMPPRHCFESTLLYFSITIMVSEWAPHLLRERLTLCLRDLRRTLMACDKQYISGDRRQCTAHFLLMTPE